MEKICTKCNQMRQLIDFRMNKNTGKYLNSCRSCCNKQRAERRRDPIVKERDRLWRAEYRSRPEFRELKKQKHIEYYARPGVAEHHRETCARWYRNNKEKQIQKKTKNEILRRHIDPNYRMICVLRSRLSNAIKMKGTRKMGHTMDLLGCNIGYFKNWIEFQFDDKMNWNNHGTYWHIDHVKPCSSYDLTNEQEQRACFHWSNMRPIEKTENIIKGDKIDELLIQYQQELAYLYEWILS